MTMEYVAVPMGIAAAPRESVAVPRGSVAVLMESVVVPTGIRSFRNDLSSVWDYLPVASAPVAVDNLLDCGSLPCPRRARQRSNYPSTSPSSCSC